MTEFNVIDFTRRLVDSDFADENDFVRQLHAYLMQRGGWLSFPQNSHVAHANTRYVPGTPDIIALHVPSLFSFYLECKMPGETLSDSQKIMQAIFKKNGVSDLYRVVYPEMAVRDVELMEAYARAVGLFYDARLLRLVMQDATGVRACSSAGPLAEDI